MIIIGAPNSSNSNRLVEVALQHGCPRALLVQRAADLNWDWLENVGALGLSAGASAPEILVDEVIDALKKQRDVRIKEISITQENVHFKVPSILTSTAA